MFLGQRSSRTVLFFLRYKTDGADGAIRLAISLQCPADLVTEASMQCLQKASADVVARSQIAPRFAPVFNRPPLSRPQIREALEKSSSSKQLATRLVGYELLERWQNATGIVLDAATGDATYQDAVGDVLVSAESHVLYNQDAVGDVLEDTPILKAAKWPEYETLRRTIMKLGPKEVIAQPDPKRQRCRALRDSGAAPSLP
ncbi:hypothetical protein MRX96_050074 [Rhipicephalus microplus]